MNGGAPTMTFRSEFVFGVVLAAKSAHLSVGSIDFDDVEAVLIENSGDGRSVRASAFDTDTDNRDERREPLQQLAVAFLRGFGGVGVELSTEVVDHGDHVKVLVRVYSRVCPGCGVTWFWHVNPCSSASDTSRCADERGAADKTLTMRDQGSHQVTQPCPAASIVRPDGRTSSLEQRRRHIRRRTQCGQLTFRVRRRRPRQQPLLVLTSDL